MRVYCFHAEWCHSCPVVASAFNELKSEMQDESMEFIDVDVESDKGVDLSSMYQVRNVPTVLIVKNNRVVERISGTISKEKLREIISKWK